MTINNYSIGRLKSCISFNFNLICISTSIYFSFFSFSVVLFLSLCAILIDVVLRTDDAENPYYYVLKLKLE